MPHIFKFLLTLLLFLPSFFYGQSSVQNLIYASTIKPVRLILGEMAKNRAQVIQLVPPGASPHHFEPTPASIRDLEKSRACFYISEKMEPWITHLDHPKTYSLINMLPEASLLDQKSATFGSKPGNADPHFWTDPVTIRKLLPALKSKLIELDPDGRDIYIINYLSLTKSLDELNDGLSLTIKRIKPGPFILSHPFFNYFLIRNNIEIAGIISPAGEIQPSPLTIARLINIIPQQNVSAVLTMPEQSQLGGRTVAESGKIPLVLLDPLGNRKEVKTILDLLNYNIGQIMELSNAR